uniref:putative germin-like protein 9-2 n=1 Tax=Fragaria vesca subsp. vesca TaxID=101020 RepID=UPI0005CB2BC7|nr:PREDICTED: putative germin-like protein 9-2 [Fragaria vesca subsp. vesca]
MLNTEPYTRETARSTIYLALARYSSAMSATMRLIQLLVIISVVALAISRRAVASDPDISSDFILPENHTGTTVDASFFTYTGFRGLFDQTPEIFTATKASMDEFPALKGQSVSYAMLQFPPNTIFPPHTRLDSAGLMLVLTGSLEVGLIDSKNVLYIKKLQAGDMFVFPKGLIHYQYNADPNLPATAIASFGSASARSVAVPDSIFTSGIREAVLAKSFKTDISTVRKIRAGLKN